MMHPEEIVDKALEFLKTKAGYLYPRLEGITFDKTASAWEVTVDVGVFSTSIKKVKLDDRDGRVIGFA